MGTGGDDFAIVDQRHLPITNLAGTGDRVIHIGERDAWTSARDEILVVIGQYNLAAALKGDPMLDEFKLRLVSSGIERDTPGVVDDAAKRQHGAVANRHGSSVVEHWRLLEHEVA